jgi:hypothetical protein
MQFFKGKRPEFFFHTAKPRRDKQTGKRFWCVTMIVTMHADLSISCGDCIAAAYSYLLTAENLAEEVLLLGELPGCAITYYAQVDDAYPALQLAAVDVGGFRLTRKKETVELWFGFEAELDTPGLHGFVKQFVYTRLWAAFTPGQGELGFDPKERSAAVESPLIAKAAEPKKPAKKRVKDPG